MTGQGRSAVPGGGELGRFRYRGRLHCAFGTLAALIERGNPGAGRSSRRAAATALSFTNER